MEEKFVLLTAYVEGHEISWLLNPTPKTLYTEIHEFAGSICEACKIIIRNQVVRGQGRNNSVSVMIFCEGLGVLCNSYTYNTDEFLMNNASFEHKMFGYKLTIAKTVAASVVATIKFRNQGDV